jgi:hypothetical protein
MGITATPAGRKWEHGGVEAVAKIYELGSLDMVMVQGLAVEKVA